MFTYGFTDFSNGSSAFGSISSQVTPLESSTSRFSDYGSQSIQLAVDDSTTLARSTSDVANDAGALSIQPEVGTMVPASSASDISNNASPSIEPAVDFTTLASSTSDFSNDTVPSIQLEVGTIAPASSISDLSNNAVPSIELEVGSITPVSSLAATTSLGSGSTGVAFGNVGSSAFGSTFSQPTPLESSACEFSNNGCPSIQPEVVSTALASSTSDLSNNGGPSIQPEVGTVAPASSMSDLSNNGSPSIEPAMDSTAPVSSRSDLSNNGGLSIQPAVVDSLTPASSTSGSSNNDSLSIQPAAVGSITPTPVSPFAATTSFGIGGTKVAIGYAAFGNVGSSTVFGYPPSQPSPSGSSSSFCTSARPSIQHGSSLFGQKPAFGGFWSTTPSQSSPFGGSTFQQTQSAFGSIPFGSSAPFGAPSQHSFGTTSIPVFGVTSTPAFSAPTTAAFGARTASAFGSQPTAAFGAATTSAFGSRPTATFGSGGVFGTPAFSSTSNPAFGATTAASTFGTSNTPFGAQPFSFGTSPAFGQTNSGFGSSPFGSTPSAFGAQSSTFGTQTTTPSTFGSPGAFGQPGFSVGQQQRGGSKVVAYAPTAETDDTGAQSSGKFESISAMPVYKEKSHEELRWEDCQLSDKGSSSVFGSCPTQTSPFGSSSSFITTAANTATQHARGNVAPDPVASHGSWIIPPYASAGERSWTPSRQTEPHPMLLSISAMPVYVDKSPEELRWIDYQVGDKGGWVQKHGVQLKCVPHPPFGNSAPAFGSSFTASNQPLAWGNFQSSIFPPRGGFQSQSSISGSPSPASGFLRPTFGVPTASVFESSGFESATPYVRPRWGSRVASYTPTAEDMVYPLSGGFKQINAPIEGKEIDGSSSTYLPVPQDKKEGKAFDASSSTHCPEPQHKEPSKQTGKKKMQDVRKAVEVECSSRHCPEPQDKEHGKQIDKKKLQDLRKAVEVECEVEGRVSVKHIAFLTSMLEKLDSLNI
ncbi:hypothetical protein MKW98_018901 [Papaver atlanticum]|uniref:Uncharacterized protein n=1 Tax=Papaver atlanticum TaxID=357466 RepID=A0AAD4TJ48_9MAGN|nr:hypothetical protein MKW98_018901 [Papaver atlanticum]